MAEWYAERGPEFPKLNVASVNLTDGERKYSVFICGDSVLADAFNGKDHVRVHFNQDLREIFSTLYSNGTKQMPVKEPKELFEMDF